MKKLTLILGLCCFTGFGFLKPDIEIDGRGKNWNLLEKGSLTVPTGGKLALKRMAVDNLQGTASSSRLVVHHSTSQLVLENSTLSLDGNYSFTQGSLVVKGDCTITGTAGTLFTFNGHNILIDDNSTLRIKNVTFQSSPTSRIRQLIRYGNSKSKFILENATFKVDNAPSALLSSGGMMMVGGNLVIEGSSVIDNTSTSSMHALFLGNGSYSSSDCRLVIRSGSKLTVNNAGIVFKSVGVGSLDLSGGKGTLAVETGANFLPESQINLGGSTFNFDFSSLSGISKTTTSTLSGTPINGSHGAAINDIDWSPNGQYFLLGAASEGGVQEMRVYGFDGSSFTPLHVNFHGAVVNSVSWHPTGVFAAIGGLSGLSGYTHRLYSFDGTETTSLLRSMIDHGSTVWSVDWSPNGRYLAIGGEQGTGSFTHRVYSFDGSVTVTLPGCNKDHGVIVYSVAWSPSGKYLAIGGEQSTGSFTHRVYGFDGIRLTELVNSRGDHGNDVRLVAWSSDEKFLAIGGVVSGGVSHRIYSFDGSGLTEITNENHGDPVYSVSWSPEGTFFAIGGDQINGSFTHRVYSFNGSSLITLVSLSHSIVTGEEINSVSWYPDGRYFAVGGVKDSDEDYTHRAYPSVYSSSNAVFPFQNATLNLGGGAFRLDNIELKGN